jgi:hypothetical protein
MVRAENSLGRETLATDEFNIPQYGGCHRKNTFRHRKNAFYGGYFLWGELIIAM